MAGQDDFSNIVVPNGNITNGAHSSAPASRSEDLSSWHPRKVTSEFADDLDKVREANDFTNRSVLMLIHALKQGEGIFLVEERRIMSATTI
ncbi:hypothetical protein K469DRAFT_710885 [Zopfia rhizophila CBS 207.26]|uniref:Ribosome assembly protein 3 n=1 Tax=Zopfia rhizophila CBS 207.26 TaxID=1314779 RepID=A0A6A6DUX6_9PEZI|nr:hypothetical protein K469DRAFT_710885 [Zopfia rhizophila CBS 207.26]